jgi:hypothetical protein
MNGEDTVMEQLEKVCKALGQGFGNGVGNAISFQYPGMEKEYNVTTLLGDALALIQQQQARIKELEAAQTARVMTLEELENALDTVVWVEEPEFENFADHYALIMAYSHKVGFVRVSFGFAEMPVDCEYEYEDYGKKWRCWTQRPTDEQREAAKWE